MLVGTGDPRALEKDAPTLARFDAPELALPDCVFVQALSEIAAEPMCAMLPPALHPTLPPVVSFGAFDVPDSAWGPFRLAQVRIECRSGLRPRGLLVAAVVDVEAARVGLAERFGFRTLAGEVEIARAYDATRLRVVRGGAVWLSLAIRAPQRLGESDTQFVSSLHPAQTPRGFRLVQVDVEHAVRRAERGAIEIEAFDAAAWGEARIRPSYALPAVVGRADVTIRPIRYACRADVLAFEGTESVAAG
ncbi:MAG: acetoacetate decarboxylase family protein [Myxococcota bacterium]